MINASVKSRHFSFQEDKRGSVNVHSDISLAAIEKRSVEQSQECVRQQPECINGHGGPFYITPSHSAVEHNWVDGVRESLKNGASVCVRNQYDQTPLHYAGRAKQETIMSLSLDSHNSASAVNLHDMRGMSPLHESAASGCLPVVKSLLKNGANVCTHDKQGESPLHKAAKAGAFDAMVALMQAGADLRERDLRGICAMRWLILSTANGLQRLSDHSLTTSVVGSRRSPITFEFSASVCGTGMQQCQLLSYFIETHNREILAHPVCHVFLLIKWKRAKLVFSGYLLYFVVYSLLTSCFIFMRQLGRATNETLSSNATQAVQLESATNETLYTNAYDAKPTTHSYSSRVIQVCSCIMTPLLLMISINRLRIQGCAFLKTSYFWIQSSSVLCVSSLLTASWILGADVVAVWEHHIGTMESSSIQLQFLLILRKYPSHGLYVSMFIRVAEDFLRSFFVYSTLLVSFTITMFSVFNMEYQPDPVFARWPSSFLKSSTMMVGSVDVTDHLASQLDRLPYTSYVLYFFFVLFISIVSSNSLVALAVSDIRELRASAHLTRLASMVEAILNMEQSCDFPVSRRSAPYCTSDTMVTQVRLWPQHDARHPSVMVEDRKVHVHPSLQLRPRWYAWSAERMQPSRYQVNIPSTSQEDVSARIAARETITVDADKMDVPHDYKVLFDEIIRRSKILEVSHLH